MRDNRYFDDAGVRQLEALIADAGGRQKVAHHMAQSKGNAQPNESELEAAALRLKRIVATGSATMTSLRLIAPALEVELGVLLALSSPERKLRKAEVTPGRTRKAEEKIAPWLDLNTESGRLCERLNRAS
jgi:hypothetical protein